MNIKALHKIGYGVYVVTSKKGERINGQIANTVFQVTSEPPTIAVSINKGNLTHEFIKESRVFAASVLCQDTPMGLIGRFGFKSGRDIDKFEGVSYRTGETGVPVVIDSATAYMEVRVRQEVDVGTHTIFIGDVVAGDVLTDAACMTYEHYHRVKGGTTPKTAATYVEEKKVVENKSTATIATKFRCIVCGYVYDPAVGDPDSGIAPGTRFEDLPAAWVCPVCGAAKDKFEKVA